MILISSIDVPADVELVAKALFGYVNCPGLPWDEIPWPPKNKSTLMGYLNRAEAVVEAQQAHSPSGSER